MLSSSPAIPLSSIDFAQDHQGGTGRRLSLMTANGKEFFTNRDGLPSPHVLTPVEGNTPTGSGTHTPRSVDDREHYDQGNSLFKANSRGGIWHDEVSVGWWWGCWFGCWFGC